MNMVFNKSLTKSILSHLTILNIAIFLFIVLFVAAGVTFFVKKPEYIEVTVRGAAGNWWWITPPPPYYLTRAIDVGDKEFNAQGNEIAQILSIRHFGTGSQNRAFISAEDEYFILRVRLRVSKDKRTQKLWFKGNVIGIGSPIVLETGKAVVNGTITAVDVSDLPPEREAFAILRLYNVFPWEAEKISVGDTETDGSEQVIFEVLEKSVVQAQMTVVNDRGDVFSRRNPSRVDMTIRVKIRGRMVDNEFVYREDTIVKSGKILFVSLPNYDLNGIFVVDVELPK